MINNEELLIRLEKINDDFQKEEEKLHSIVGFLREKYFYSHERLTMGNSMFGITPGTMEEKCQIKKN